MLRYPGILHYIERLNTYKCGLIYLTVYLYEQYTIGNPISYILLRLDPVRDPDPDALDPDLYRIRELDPILTL